MHQDRMTSYYGGLQVRSFLGKEIKKQRRQTESNDGLACLTATIFGIACPTTVYKQRMNYGVLYTVCSTVFIYEELAAAKKRKLQIEMEHATAGAIGPAWAAGLQVAVQNLTRNVDIISRDVGNLT